MSVRAVGDRVVVEGSEATRLYGAHGVVAEYKAMSIAASLVDPPRLALRAKTAPQTVALVDVASGEIEEYVSVHPFSTWFDRDGALCGFDGAGTATSFVRFGDARESYAMPNALPWLADATFDVDERVLFGRVPYGPATRVVCVRPAEKKRRLAWRHRTEDGASFVATATARECLVVHRPRTGMPAMAVRALADAALVATRVDVDTPSAGASPALRALHVAIDAATSSFARASLLTARGRLLRFRRNGDKLERFVDADAHLAEQATSGGSQLARAFFGANVVVVDTGAWSACFAPSGDAVAIVDGSLRRIADDGALDAIEGPTKLTAIAPHPRGVVALDGEGRAHVVDIERGAA